MSEETQSTDAAEEPTLSFERMPGADPMEDNPKTQLDLSFSEPEPQAEAEVVEQEDAGEPEPEVAEEEEAPTAEAESEEGDGEPETADSEPDGEGEDGDGDGGESDEAQPEEELPLAAQTEQKSPMVPKSRLDEVLAKQKALQKQLDEVKAANEKPAEAPEEYDFDAKEIEYQQLVLDGEAEKAVALRKEIRNAEKAQIEWEMEQKMGQTVQQSQQATALQQAAAEMEAAFPVFDQNSDQFNEDYTNEVVELRDAFIIKGYDPVDALGKAVNYVVKDRGLDSETPDESALAAPQQKVEQAAKKKANVAKKLKAASAQPPELEGEGSSSRGENVVNLERMSEDEFNALPEATLRRLRGDIV